MSLRISTNYDFRRRVYPLPRDPHDRPVAGATVVTSDGYELRYLPRDEPRLIVEFNYAGTTVRAHALIDTGSVRTLLPQQIAQKLGLQLDPPQLSQASGGTVQISRIHRAAPTLTCALVLDDDRLVSHIELDPGVLQTETRDRHPDYDVQLGLNDFVAAFSDVTFSLQDAQAAFVRLTGGPRTNPLADRTGS